jgi:PBSX family phage terminase large subunit
MSEVEVQIPRRAFLPCYHHLLNSEADINFLWGGRDSGKSYFVAQNLIKKCLASDYFRCILVKKTENSIKDSQWQTIKDVVDAWGLTDLFRFKQAPLSIECINGNKFIARGCDDPAKLKSIKDPSDVWYEEGNQLDIQDFITVATTLRSNKVKVQQWFSFNPEAPGDYEEFWLYKTFFETYSGDLYKNFTSTWSIEIPNGQKVGFTYTSTHTTYIDNKHCKPERVAFLEQLSILDPYYYQVFTLGKWGNRKNEDPFCYTYNRQKHVKTTTLDRRREVLLSFDFNVNPITCGVYQWIEEIRTLRGIETIKKDNSNIYVLCEYIAIKYKGCVFKVTGDATGQNTTALVQDGINYYTVIKQKLNLSVTQIKTPSVNPKIEENRVLVNAAFHTINVELDPVNCKHLIFDCENVSVTDMGKIDKGDRSNPKKRSDHMDHFRYLLNTFFRWILKQ